MRRAVGRTRRVLLEVDTTLRCADQLRQIYVLAEKGSVACVTYGALPAAVPKQTHGATRYKESAAASCVTLWNSMMKQPYADTDLAVFVTKRTLQLRPKSQIDIPGEAGFVNANVC